MMRRSLQSILSVVSSCVLKTCILCLCANLVDEIFSLYYVHIGVDGIINKLKSDASMGIKGDTFPSRTHFFGNNVREKIKAKSFCTIFFEALDDFMLKVLIVAATGSLIFEYIGADPEDYGHGKSTIYIC